MCAKICTLYVLLYFLFIIQFTSSFKNDEQYYVNETLNIKREHRRMPYNFSKISTMKHILLWTGRACYECSPFNYIAEGQELFKMRYCPNDNCYITENRKMLGDYAKFDALLFNGRKVLQMRPSDYPRRRSKFQVYVFAQLESAENFPMCNTKYNNYFNRTMTYRLDSDYPWPYLEVVSKKGRVLGPSKDMKWISNRNMMPIDKEIKKKLKKKTKAAAWFASVCMTRSKREDFVANLVIELESYNLTLDTYGFCGEHKCYRSEKAKCEKFLEDDYYFYLAFENSLSEDYVTEKVLRAVQHYTVPVVYGAGNYTRFLPPGSYLDARELGYEMLAEVMAHLISYEWKYQQMFRWKNYYDYRDSMHTAFCSLCVSLHQKREMNVYTNFREWWHPFHEKRCQVEYSHKHFRQDYIMGNKNNVFNKGGRIKVKRLIKDADLAESSAADFTMPINNVF